MNIISNQLKPIHLKYGLSLLEDEDFLYLERGDGKVLARFSSCGGTLEEIWKSADKEVEEYQEQTNNMLSTMSHIRGGC